MSQRRIRKEELERVVEDTLGRLGKLGRWQVSMYCLICLSFNLSGTWHMMSIVFTGGEPHSFYCKNSSPPNNGSTQCETNGCSEWVYNSTFGNTIVTEWDLVCDKNYVVEMSQTIFSGGVMLGALVFSPLSDAIGRKTVHLLCQWASVVVGVASAFSTSFVSFAVGRFFLGALREGLGLTGIIMVCELFPASSRAMAGIILQLFWSLAWMLLALIAYFIRDWRQLQLAISIPTVFTISYIWLISESIPWLLVKGRLVQAERVLRRAARCNGLNVDGPILVCDDHQLMDEGGDSYPPEDEIPDAKKQTICCCCCKKDRLQDSSGPSNMPRPETLFDICQSPYLALSATLMCLIWCINIIVYYGLSLSSSQLAGDPYLNFFFSGLVEVPAYIITAVTVHFLGRRWPLFVFHVIAGTSLFAMILIPESAHFDWLRTALWMLGKFGITASLAVLVLYTAEIFPTQLRNSGFGVAASFGRMGGMIAPFTAYLGKTMPWLPSVLFGSIALAAALMGIFLPETRGRPLPQTIADVERWHENMCSCFRRSNSDSSLNHSKIRLWPHKKGRSQYNDTVCLHPDRKLTSILKYSSSDLLNDSMLNPGYKETTI